VKFDFTINVSEILTAVVLLVGFFVAHTQNIEKLQDIKTKVDLMFKWFHSAIVMRKNTDD
jgi:hypothetical protein